MGEHHHRRSECGVHARKRERLHAEIFKRSEMSRKARYESTQSAESKGKKRLGDFARGAAQAPPCTEKNDALQDPRSEEHTSELQSLMRISYAVFCLKKKKKYYDHQQQLHKQSHSI